MKLDEHFTYLMVCPKTEKLAHYYESSGGICTRCGHDNDSTFTHAVAIIGKWKRPSWSEWLFGSRKTFVEKDDDK